MAVVDFSSTFLTSDWVLARVSDYEVFSYYMGGDFRIGRAYLSPLRYEKRPSFCIYTGPQGLCFKDFGGQTGGNCFRFVMELYSISFFESIRRVAEDFKLIGNSGQKMDVPERVKVEKVIEKPPSTFKIDYRPFRASDIQFWRSYGISPKTLAKFDVMACRRVLLIEGDRIKCSVFEGKGNPTYSFGIGSRHKIYKPFDTKIKWLSNTNVTDIQGYKQLAEKGKVLIVTKGLKDVMLLDELGYSAIAPQSETSFIPASLIDSLKSRFDKIFIWFDNDTVGIEAATKLSHKYMIKPIFTGTKEQKDVSDYYKYFGEEKTKELIMKLIE